MTCSHCGSAKTKQNGHTHYGKQNYFCHACCRQFVEGGQDWFVSDADKLLINKLLLERISLAGICRVCGVGQTWLLVYLKDLYGQLPDHLYADLRLPDLEAYLAARMDEEIGRLSTLKKNSIAYQEYVQIAGGETDESAGFDEAATEGIVGDEIENNDFLLNELYGKERGARVVLYGIQLDEMWTFVGRKECPQWLWLALNPGNRQIVAFHVGGRSGPDAAQLYEKIPAVFKGHTGFFSDYWRAYSKAFEHETHIRAGKKSGLTAYMERFNCTLRQRASRLVRKALSFSKSLENHIGSIKYFICDYNKKLAHYICSTTWIANANFRCSTTVSFLSSPEVTSVMAGL